MDLYMVTGASRGLGLALVRELGGESAFRVLALSRRGLPAETLVWREARADLGTDDGQRIAADAIVAALGAERWSRAVLINNAATLEPLGVLGRVEMRAVQQAVAANLTAPMVLTNAFLTHSADVPIRTVVNISSGSGRRPISGSGTYCATKAGLDMISRVLALEAEAAGANVRITSLAPGIIDTDMQVAARTASETDLPSVGMFRNFKAENLLKTPAEVAARIIELERSGKLPAGIADIRELS